MNLLISFCCRILFFPVRMANKGRRNQASSQDTSRQLRDNVGGQHRATKDHQGAIQDDRLTRLRKTNSLNLFGTTIWLYKGAETILNEHIGQSQRYKTRTQ